MTVATHDLHTHTLYSDGTLTPSVLVAQACANGVDTLAVTDHDVTDGLAEAATAARLAGLGFVPGVEISVTWQRQTIHIVGLCIDSADVRLQEGLARLRELRLGRAREIGRRLLKKNIDGAYDRACRLARGSVVSRTHFARDLVLQGFVASMAQAFKQYLGRGGVAHVPGQWASLDEAVGWIRGAGGIAVMAHPLRYPLSSAKLKRLVHEFRECGGEALEFSGKAQKAGELEYLTRLTLELKMFGSQGSDYHGPENPWVNLGKLPALPRAVTPVWEAFGGRRPAPA